MKVLVIGNGFDLAHGLATRYVDFLSFVKQFNQVYDINEQDGDFFLRSGEFLDFLIKLFRTNDRETTEIIREFRETTDENIWIRHLNGILEANEKIGENWIDFEKEIMIVIEWMEGNLSNEDSLDGLEAAYENISNNIKDKISRYFKPDFEREILDYKVKGNRDAKSLEHRLIKKYLKHLDDLIRAFEMYLTFYIYPSIKGKLDDDILSLDLKGHDQIISFNYTDTYNRIYKNNIVLPENIHFIHGKAREDNQRENNMIIGIDETLKTPEEVSEKLEYVEFKKYFQRIVKETDTSYTRLFKTGETIGQEVQRNETEAIDVYIFGHSLDKTDTDIIKMIFNAANTRIVVYSHDKETQKKQVSNLITIIGKDELLKSTYNSEPKVKFKLQKNSKN